MVANMHMLPTKLLILVLALVICVLVPNSVAQVPSNALLRVFEIKVGDSTGTAFTIERRGKQFLVTARHVVDGLPARGATVEIFRGGYWMKLKVDILLPKNPEVDIAVLDIPEPLSVTYELVPETEGLVFGQEVYFLGFPDGLHTLAGTGRIPFIKRGTVSAQDATDPTAVVWYVDGFNNPGFSGGPVVFLDRKDNKWKVAAVVKGYKPEPAKVRLRRQSVDTKILVNSGILIAYDIRHALEAIETMLEKK